MYPFSSSPIENQEFPTGKHNGMKVVYRGPDFHAWPTCGNESNNDLTGNTSPNCVIATRGLIHVMGSMADLAARYHSGFMQNYLCKPPYRIPQDCGSFSTGGIIDYAQLQAPHYNTRRERPATGYALPTFTIDFGAELGRGYVLSYTADNQYTDLPATSGEPYVFGQVYTADDLTAYRNNPPSLLDPGSQPGSMLATIDQWSTNDGDCEPKPASDPCHNAYYHFLYQVGDGFHLVDPTDIRVLHWICEVGKPCHYNGTDTGLNETMVNIVPEWDMLDGVADGFATWSGFSDKWGNPYLTNSPCTAISNTCISFILDHAPVGVAAVRSDNGCECNVWEHDVYFNGQPSGWVKFPN